MDDKNEAHTVDLDWENRVLCSDESCIGTIGPDGRCRECGKPYEGPLPETRLPSQAVDDGKSSHAYENADESKTATGTEVSTDDALIASSSSDSEWEHRVLCIDESCIGVMGPDGRCKECGKLCVPKD